MKVCIIGAFGFDMLDKTTGGQPVKTRQLFHALSDYYGDESVTYIETYGWKSHPIRIMLNIKRRAKINDVMIMLPAHNGVQVFSRLLNRCKKRYGLKIFYDVIGGWLPEKTKRDKALKTQLLNFDGIWVETHNMKDLLDSQGFSNIKVVPNFRKMKIIEPSQMTIPHGFPLRMCTFSRVMKEKGIETAVDVVNELNKKMGYKAIRLDIYGPIDETEKEWFETLEEKFADNISYCGCVNPKDSYKVLSQYYCLLFPTHFYTEGVPGTIIDAYAAGLPVVSAKWSNFDDVIEEGKTGYGYSFDDKEDMERVLSEIVNEPSKIITLKTNCLDRARSFHADCVVKNIVSDMQVKQ